MVGLGYALLALMPLIYLVRRERPRNRKFLYFLLPYHYLITFAFYRASLAGTDATYYYATASELDHFEFGTKRFYILTIVRVLTKLGLSYESATFVFSTLGLVGIVLTARVIFRFADTRRQARLAKLVLMFPGMHYWTSGIGKDSLIIFSFGLALYSIWKSSSLRMFPAILNAFLVRPHFGLPLAVAALYPKITLTANRKQRNLILLVTLVFFVIVYRSGGLFMGFGSIEEGLEFLKERESVLNYGAYGAAFVNYPYLVRAIYMVFYPITIPKTPMMAIVVAENLATLYMMGSIFWRIIMGRLENSIWKNSIFVFTLTCFVLLDGTISWSVYNLGIIVRQETIMVLCIATAYFVTNASLKVDVFMISSLGEQISDIRNFLAAQGVLLLKSPAIVKTTKMPARNILSHHGNRDYLRIPGKLVRRVLVDMTTKRIVIYLRR